MFYYINNNVPDPCTIISGRYLALTVPGLAEKRPSLLVGDAIHARQLAGGVPAGPFFEGCVHEVRPLWCLWSCFDGSRRTFALDPGGYI